MQSSESVKQLAEAIGKAQAEFKSVGKSGKNKFDNYAYANLEDYVHVVRPVLSRHGLSVLTSVDEVLPLEIRTTKNGGREHAVRVKVAVRLLHNSGEWIEAHSWGEGQDRADKSVYKAITGARKYALASVLGLATTDDPEADESVGRDKPGDDTQGRGSQPPAQQPRQPAPPDANAAQIRELKELLPNTTLPRSTTAKWLKAAGVKTLEEMPADHLAKCLEYAKKHMAGAAQSAAA